MCVVFVIGPACAGKSTYIKNNYPNRKKIDLFDFQTSLSDKGFNYDSIMLSYIQCKEALVEGIKKGEDIVLEHTMLRACRRKDYIDAVREVSDIPIEVVVVYPSDNQIYEQGKLRGVYRSKEVIKRDREIFEMPKYEEGFSKITII